MKSDDERIEEFLGGIVLPEYKSDGHARQLRAQILSGLEAGRAGSGTGSRRKTAALLLGLLAAGAVAAEIIIQVHRYNFEGKVQDGEYLFSTWPGKGRTNNGSSDGSMIIIHADGDLDAAGIEKKRQDLEEVDALRKRSARELWMVTDTEVNGKSLARAFNYKYVLADGHMEGRTESDGYSESDQRQIADLQQRGQEEILSVSEMEVGGQRQRLLWCRFVLSDGRVVLTTVLDSEMPGPCPLTLEQQREYVMLFLGDKGEFLVSTQAQVHGRTFNLRKNSFTLSDGTAVTRSEGYPEGPKNYLTTADWTELHQLSAAHKGETLGTYEEDVTGKPFKFTRVKYVLSDGTEVIQSTGKPGSER
jgi:hypothetical protein